MKPIKNVKEKSIIFHSVNEFGVKKDFTVEQIDAMKKYGVRKKPRGAY